MSDPVLLAETSGPVRVLTLHRPAALNSLNGELQAALMQAVDAVARDASIRCLLITGAGRGFCAGQDLTDPLAAPAPAGAEPSDLGVLIRGFYRPFIEKLRALPVPTVAAVNGVAAGAGASLALACDLVVAARSASFVQAFSKIGLIPDSGGTWLLPRLVGPARATGLAFLGDKLPAAEAQAMGLIWQCVEDAELPERAQALAQRLAQMPTRALVQTRQALSEALLMPLSEALDMEARVQGELGRAHDYLEGVAAFAAKRAPKFQDR